MDDDGPVPAVLVAVAGLAGLTDFFAAVAALTGGAAGFLDALFSFVAGAFAVAETFFAAGTAGAFFAAGLDAGVALAAGFFTVTGSLDELERAFTGCLLPWEPLAAFVPRGLHVVGVLAFANPGVIPPKALQKRAAPRAGSHILSNGRDVAPGTGARLYRELETAGDVSACRSPPVASAGVAGGGGARPALPWSGTGPSDHSIKESKP